jgi:hypothetical protein
LWPGEKRILLRVLRLAGHDWAVAGVVSSILCKRLFGHYLIRTPILVASERRTGLCGDATRASTQWPGFGATGRNARSRCPAILAGKR